MTKEDKELLLKDLCARLPYHVRVKVWLKDKTTEEGVLDLEHNYGDVLRDAFYCKEIIDIKPYLCPISSMTEEEYKSVSWEGCSHTYNYSSKSGFRFVEIKTFTLNILNWLNAHHFDYRGLIERGLAIEVTKENNPYK